MTAARAFAARVAVDAAAATTAVEIAGGVRLATPELPDIWDLNCVLLAPGADAALIDQTLHALPAETRRATVFDPADPVGPTRGWTVSHCLLMVAGDVPAFPPAAEVITPAELRPAQLQAYSDAGADISAMLDRFAAFPGYQAVAARVDGEIAAWAIVANGSIDDVWTQPAFRGRGLGRAVTAAALAAGGWFLWTESADPVPQALYRSLGMIEIGTVVQLTRDPG